MKTVLITGATSGIGMALANTYRASGWQVIACGRSTEKLTHALGDPDESLRFCVFDMDKRDAVIANTRHLDRIDLVILNAGTCEYIDLHEGFDSALFERVIRTNLIGTGYCIEALLPRIKTGGQLGIISSTVTLLPLNRAEAYGSSKAALDYLSRTLAIDLAQQQIDVSLIRPGFVDTPLTAKNTFPMPGMISSDKACRYIVNGLAKRKQEINFPRGFYYALKSISLLPNSLWRRIAINTVGAQK